MILLPVSGFHFLAYKPLRGWLSSAENLHRTVEENHTSRKKAQVSSSRPMLWGGGGNKAKASDGKANARQDTSDVIVLSSDFFD